MNHDDLLIRIQRNGRLHGRNESRRVTTTVLGVLSELLPAPAYRRLTAALPEELRQRLPIPEPGGIIEILDVRRFLSRVTERLYADSADAAFLARVVLSELNATDQGVRPAQLAHLVPADLRPLFRSRPAQPWSAALPQPRPAVTSPLQPVATVEPQPVVMSQPRPVATVQRLPAATVQPAPVAAVQPLPAVMSQPRPAAAVQSLPAVTVQSAPAVTAQSAPAATVQT
ncbi:hypothetical protein GCM10010168_28770 [Actinoplanes ianthinogenes]|uniref:DUF2267 domain-containing protein n=1 Tax=Actinoplanes ianthinogenes TaxID=122358 RepID=A0ABM7LL95_9ACTN|nr:DUF2267 domain-containing protein [Actinoplanes ianthinogenes]BCJ40019.1 hypothetical protein Aiant_06760 [Actinoplanes ianthinogenes]GGR09715.1 hypothetical protein GCM10010168_28770 [Actinoplanes ianthinogenes]